jgi:hypothetical protein
VVYVIGVIILLNAFRMRDWFKIFCQGSAIFVYDLTVVGFLCYILYAFPAIYGEMRN